MFGLHRGHRLAALFAGTAVSAALVAGAALGIAPAATAEPVGGGSLDSLGVSVALGPGAHPLPRVKAATWLLADADTGAVLATKGAHVQRAPASTLKMLTALAVMPHLPPETRYIATSTAANTYGSRVGLRPGRAYTLDQLWYAVFLPSANDAAIAVAEANGGVHRTITQMNAIARELRALDTVARTPNGLDAPGQRSSAYDLALIAREGLTRDDFSRYAATTRAEFPNVKGRKSHPIYTTNRLLLHGWRGAIGVKTGFTSQAGRTYVGAATRGGRTLIVTLMGIRESSETAAKKLLTWGFNNADVVTPVGVLVDKGSTVPEPVPSPSTSAVTATGGDGRIPTAAAPSSAPEPMPWPTLLAAAAALAGAGAAAVVVSRRTRTRARGSTGRHSARAGSLN